MRQDVFVTRSTIRRAQVAAGYEESRARGLAVRYARSAAGAALPGRREAHRTPTHEAHAARCWSMSRRSSPSAVTLVVIASAHALVVTCRRSSESTFA